MDYNIKFVRVQGFFFGLQEIQRQSVIGMKLMCTVTGYFAVGNFTVGKFVVGKLAVRKFRSKEISA